MPPFDHAAAAPPVLTVDGLRKRFGGIVVAEDIALVARRGECLGIIGPNGAGKTSLFNLIDGSVAADAGSIRLEGAEIGHLPKEKRARRGVARAFQVPQPFVNLSTFENVLTFATFAGRGGDRSGEIAADSLARCGLTAKADRPAGQLTLLDRKRLELARAIAARPRLLLLDEIAGGLTEPEVAELVRLIHALKPGFAILWIEHVAHALTAVADRILVLDFGRPVIEGAPGQVMQSREVRQIYLGMDPDAAA